MFNLVKLSKIQIFVLEISWAMDIDRKSVISCKDNREQDLYIPTILVYLDSNHGVNFSLWHAVVLAAKKHNFYLKSTDPTKKLKP